jgi:hypothetical protein
VQLRLIENYLAAEWRVSCGFFGKILILQNFCICNSPKITGYRFAYFAKVRNFKGYFAIN